jgi:hypothetical protein
MRRTRADAVARGRVARRSLEGSIDALEERRPRAPGGLRRAPGGAQGRPVEPARRTATRASDEPSRALCCIGCGRVITHESSMIEVAGRHAHTCVNPAGITYRIGCFREAPGAVGVGSWSSFFSWFAEHVWQVACCAKCSMHLGWGFEPERTPSPERQFHGLIRNRLREQPGPEPRA